MDDKPRRISVWKLMEMEWQLGLLKYANEVKRKLLEARLEEIELEYQHRMVGGERLWPARLGSDQRCLPAARPALQASLDERDLEVEVLQGVIRYSKARPSEAEQAWKQWKSEVTSRLPPYVAADVIRRAEEMRERL